jgi:hypothetical protein
MALLVIFLLFFRAIVGQIFPESLRTALGGGIELVRFPLGIRALTTGFTSSFYNFQQVLLILHIMVVISLYQRSKYMVTKKRDNQPTLVWT